MQVEQLAPGLWRWTAWHEEWRHEVGCLLLESSYGVKSGRELCLFDPLVPVEDSARFWSALDRDVERTGGQVHVLITVRFHARSARALVERYGARLWAPVRGRAAIERRAGPATDVFRIGDALPAGVVARGTGRGSEVAFWIPQHRALVVGDVLLGDDQGGVRLCPASWLPAGMTADDLRAALLPLLELDVQRLIVSHGEPVLDGAAKALRSTLIR